MAFIFNKKNELLFLQKKTTSPFLPGMLVPIGGHLEEGEISDPYRACLRELEEETGLTDEHIQGLSLKYMVFRNKSNREIRTQYVFFGVLMHDQPLVESEEGSLSWIPIKQIESKSVSATTLEIIRHASTHQDDHVWVGTMRSIKRKPAITWALLEDWE
ncbi:NUDIX hydrolase [Alkalihalobacillus pseudalcaliphilus]|uniref:NUDIX hydrolase n=1 Tax=Alkalihalobacillus pseudalcaliphilus TaxID=79884 RepID=UPI00235E65D2|nr:NUDIX domain-containing protein [Alkalihalobacillus pseudalcaliphilus]